ncbi:MAG TPA: glycosyltransferase family 9 protein [Ignavibacteria bacterium]|nr:glycosyltransferase family 9 protein [Ignavibacteria bacterium]
MTDMINLNEINKVLIIQTAFLGDVILTLPLVQVLKKHKPGLQIDFLCIPETAGVLKNNPDINEVILYDKRQYKGIGKLFNLTNKLKKNKYDLIISPHRSARSTLITYFTSAKYSIAFDNSAFRSLYKIKIPYQKDIHEIQRNLSLLKPLGINETQIIKPDIYISETERKKIDEIFLQNNISSNDKIISIAPGSAWFTKRFPQEKFLKLIQSLDNQIKIILIGGKDDISIGEYLKSNYPDSNLINLIGKLNILESAEAIRRSQILITNDSAPLHIGNSVETNVYAIFGSTIPQFGFYPFGKNDMVFEINGLACRPCGIHGRTACPLGTLECMNAIDEKNIAEIINKKFK